MTFVFGIDAMPNLYEMVGTICRKTPGNGWIVRPTRGENDPARAARRTSSRQMVEAREFEDIRLVKEHVAEFAYRPTKCKRRIAWWWCGRTWKSTEGQKKLFDDARCFFYITNDEEKPAEEIVFDANDRCNQENLLEQQKSGVRSLTAPVDNLVTNWAYMVMASLAWSLKAWAALLLPVSPRWREKHAREEQRCCGWTSPRFATR